MYRVLFKFLYMWNHTCLITLVPGRKCLNVTHA